jgi:hypothetical protein
MSVKQISPAPLGLSAFAMTTTALALFVLGVLPAASASVVVPLALAYGGITQIIVGWWEGKTGSTFGFVAFSSYGAFWLYVAFLKIFIAIGLISVDPVAQGAVLVLWGFFTFYMWVASLKLNLTTSMIFLLLWLAFVILGIGDITGIKEVQIAGGAVALLTAIAAWYGALAVVINDTFGKTVLPMGKPLK